MRHLASTLTLETHFVPGAILAHEEVERRIAAQQETIRALGLGVPQSVSITERDAPTLAVERLWA